MHAPPPRIVLCHGCFDLLHVGHIRHLQEARALGDKLVVSITSDRHVNKGIGRPFFTVVERVEALKALECVDDVIISDSGTAIETIATIKPAVYVKGIDYEGPPSKFLQAEIDAVEKVGGRFHLTTTAKVSSSRILNTQRLPAEVCRYLLSARQRGFRDKIIEAFEHADLLKILFVGETIIDEYRYVAPLGKPSKEFMLATVEEKKEEFLGGIVAASKHCEWLGARTMPTFASIRKTRFVDVDFTRKLFEVYGSRTVVMSDDVRKDFLTCVQMGTMENDVVIVMDFGHGLLDEEARRIVQGAKFLAVNSQTNAGNVGFNPVTRYERADLVCVDDPEARLAALDQWRDVGLIATALRGKIKWKNMLVTHGTKGCTCHDMMTLPPGIGCIGHNSIPAFAVQVVDTIGAGDAFMAAAAPLVAAGLELEAAAFVGNVAGAIKTTIVGHRTHVTREQIMANVEALLA